MSAIYKNGTWYGKGGSGSSVDMSIIAPEFDATESYSEGERVTKDGKLYVFTDDHTGAWDAADVEETSIDDEMPTPMSASDVQDVIDAFELTHTNAWNQVVIDESGAEYVVGWYKYANGTKKPIYQTTITGLKTPNTSAGIEFRQDVAIPNIEKAFIVSEASWFRLTMANNEQIIGVNTCLHPTYSYIGTSLLPLSNKLVVVMNHSGDANWMNKDLILTIRYTKTTDTPS